MGESAQRMSVLQSVLADTPVQALRYFETVGSTNDVALEWAQAGAPDAALVVAEEQTAGRGRMGRSWFIQPGASLAFSLLLRPTAREAQQFAFFAPLGALAIAEALAGRYALAVEIKWPNDVLLWRRKVAGILVEATWQGDLPEAVVIGIGINVAPEAVPPDDQVIFPATSVEQALSLAGGSPVARVHRDELLAAVLKELFSWRKKLGSAEFFAAWEGRLAFKDEWVSILQPGQQSLVGQVLGLAPDGSLQLRTRTGEVVCLSVGDVSLRPAE